MTREVSGHSPENVQKYLTGIHYPATKEQLLKAAENNKAPENVINEIEALHGNEFSSPKDVMKAYDDMKGEIGD